MNNTVRLYDRLIKVRQVTNSTGTTNLPSNISKDMILPIAKLFIKNLADSIDSDQLVKIFNKFGKLIREPEIFYLSNGKLKCAYVILRTLKKQIWQ